MPATILLYEANPDIRELVTGLLAEEGYVVVGTGSLREGEAVCHTPGHSLLHIYRQFLRRGAPNFAELSGGSPGFAPGFALRTLATAC